MSQEAVERVLGRMITDERFRRLAAKGLFSYGCGISSSTGTQVVDWPIFKDVYTTAEQQILPRWLPQGWTIIERREVNLYEKYLYSKWDTGPDLNCDRRSEFAAGNTASGAERLLTFSPLPTFISLTRNPRHSRTTSSEIP